MRAVLLALCLSWPAAAESFADCRGLADAERLACYDRTAGEGGLRRGAPFDRV